VGDSLVAYTDGVSEAWNRNGEQYGVDRLEAVIKSSRHTPAASSLAQDILADLAKFTLEEPQADDITLLVVSR
jgi:sigma-B regulation protein RsbU (phosphoserine phosphatase)